jgi:pilus assembly protein CpaE
MIDNSSSFPKSEERQPILMFVSDPATEATMKSVATILGVSSTCVVLGGIKAAIPHLRANRSPKILIVDLADSELPISDINELADVCEPDVFVIALGTRNDVGLFREFLSLGVADYLVKPVSVDLIRRTIAYVQGAQDTNRTNLRTGRLVSIVGAHGGVGTSIIAVNLSWILAQERSKRVFLFDTNLNFGDTALMLDIKQSAGFRDVLQNPERVDSVFLDRIMVKHSDRLSILSGEEPLDMILTYDKAALDHLTPVLRNQYHYVVCDIGKIKNDMDMHLIQKSSIVVVIGDLSITAIRDMGRIINYLGTDNASRRLITVINREGMHKTEITRAECEKSIGHSISHIIPFDNTGVMQAINTGQAVARVGSPVSDSLRRLADDLTGMLQPEPNESWWHKSQKWLHKLARLQR